MQEQGLTHTQDDTELHEHKGHVVITELRTYIDTYIHYTG